MGGGIVSGGLRNSARAMSSTSFSTNSMNREPSANSIKSLNPNPQQQQQQQQQQQAVNGQNPAANSISNSKLNFIKDLQIRLMDTQKESYYLKCELETCQQKLTASIQSIKQFWSPELKRERLMRKEESTKYNMLLEQYKLLQGQYQSLLDTYEQQSHTSQQLQIQLQQMQQMQQQYAQDELNSVASAKNLFREKSLLKKTINELELRINAQKQSLVTKDETIKKLFQLVKTFGSKSGSDASISGANDTVIWPFFYSVFLLFHKDFISN